MATVGMHDRGAWDWRLPPIIPVRREATFSATRIAVQAALIVGLLLLNKFGANGAGIFFAILFCMVAYSPGAAFKAFVIGGLGLATNMALVPKSIPWTPLRLVLLFACALRFLIDLGASRKSLFSRWHYLALCWFVFIAALCSILSGFYVHIALLKLVSFWVGMTAILGGVMVLRARKIDLSEWFVALCYAVGFNGLLALAIGAGYGVRSLSVGSGSRNVFFQGPYFHPNTCGPMSAIFIVLMASTWLFSKYRNRWLCLPILPLFFSFIWMSKSRTGLGSLVAGLGTIFLLTGLAAFGRRYRLRLNMSRTNIVALAAATSLAVVVVDLGTGQMMSSALTGFANKYANQDASVDATSLLSTRRGLITISWNNFLERPLTGIGFEVSTDPGFVQSATLFSAPIEKGFLPTAILEEVGILGTVSFVLFLVAVGTSLLKTNNAPGLAMFLTYLITNLGEVSIFAMGGVGSLAWLLVGAGAMLGDHSLIEPKQTTRGLARS